MREILRHGSLFSGIGGFDLAAALLGWTNVFQVEKDERCRRLLKQNFPNTTQYGAIEDFDGSEYCGTIDVLSGGDPCQPSSYSGPQLGTADERFLWPQYFRVAKAIRPKVCVNENVPGTITNGMLDQKIIDLESEGYTCWPPLCLPSAAFGADHQRYRVWLVAYADGIGLQTPILEHASDTKLFPEWLSVTPNYRSVRYGFDLQRSDEHLRTDNVVPYWMDRIKGLGNAIDVKAAFEIFKAIEIVIR